MKHVFNQAYSIEIHIIDYETIAWVYFYQTHAEAQQHSNGPYQWSRNKSIVSHSCSLHNLMNPRGKEFKINSCMLQYYFGVSCCENNTIFNLYEQEMASKNYIYVLFSNNSYKGIYC